GVDAQGGVEAAADGVDGGAAGGGGGPDPPVRVQVAGGRGDVGGLAGLAGGADGAAAVGEQGGGGGDDPGAGEQIVAGGHHTPFHFGQPQADLPRLFRGLAGLGDPAEQGAKPGAEHGLGDLLGVRHVGDSCECPPAGPGTTLGWGQYL